MSLAVLCAMLVGVGTTIAVETPAPALTTMVVSELALRLPEKQVAEGAVPGAAYTLTLTPSVALGGVVTAETIPTWQAKLVSASGELAEHEVTAQRTLQKTARAIAILISGDIEHRDLSLDALFYQPRERPLRLGFAIGGAFYPRQHGVAPSLQVVARHVVVSRLWLAASAGVDLLPARSTGALTADAFETVVRLQAQLVQPFGNLEARAGVGIGASIMRATFDEQDFHARRTDVAFGPCASLQVAYAVADRFWLTATTAAQWNWSYPIFVVDNAIAYNRGPWALQALLGAEVGF